MTPSIESRARAALLFVALASARCAPSTGAIDSGTPDAPAPDSAQGAVDSGTPDASVAETSPPNEAGPADTSVTPGTGSPTCDPTTLRPLAPGTYRGESADGERAEACGTATGTWRYYRVAIAPGQRARIVATGLDDYQARIAVMERCHAATCLAEEYPLPTQGELATWLYDNTGTATREFFVAVGNVSGGSWDLEYTLGPIPAPPSNTTCAQAIALTSGVTLRDQDLRLGGPATPACASPGGAPTLYYRATVPSRGDLSIVTHAHGRWSYAVTILDGCGATTCIRTEVQPAFTHHNSSLRSQTFLIAVSSTSRDELGSFDLTATTSSELTTRYVESTTTGACDTLGAAGQPVAGLHGTFDEASPTTPLPAGFAFELFGQPVTHYSAHSNALLQLFADASGTATVTSFGGMLGDPRAPNGLVAPLWMNLAPAMSGASVRWALLGTAPNRRLVFDWDGWEFWEPASSAVHLQAKLFEGSHVVEFHYCTLRSTDDRATGSHATVGLESLSGTGAALHPSTSALSTTTALRFTPM